MSYRRISFVTIAIIVIARLVSVFSVARAITRRTIELACMPVIAVVRFLFKRDFRHSISLPKLIAFRAGALLKPVYRDSFQTDGHSLRDLPMRC